MARDEDYGFEVTAKRTGAYIIGANTYREIAGMGGGCDTTPTDVLTHDKSLKTNKSTRLYSGDPKELIEKIKLEIDRTKDICVFGGGEVTSQFIELGLLDELTISVIPVLLGDGVPLFTKLKEQKKLELIECKSFKSGIVFYSTEHKYKISPYLNECVFKTLDSLCQAYQRISVRFIFQTSDNKIKLTTGFFFPVIFPACNPFFFGQFNFGTLFRKSLRDFHKPGFIGFKRPVFWARLASLFI